ncbi:MAG: hypothetical protein DRJ63_06165, partial [Thermoprotei archaeon]
MADIKTPKKKKSTKRTELFFLQETILYTTLCRDISRRIYLRKGQKILGEVSLIRLEDVRSYIRVEISKNDNVVYETPALEEVGKAWDIDFEVVEDGEYIIRVECH